MYRWWRGIFYGDRNVITKGRCPFVFSYFLLKFFCYSFWRTFVKFKSTLLFLVFFLLFIPKFIFPEKKCKSKNGVIIFLVDNSKSVPKFDPKEDRKKVLREILNIAKKNGYLTRLILFGGRYEIVLDDISKFNNEALHTDFYYAFKAAIDMAKKYPPTCKFKIVFITDGILDAFPSDYKEFGVIEKDEAMSLSKNMLYRLLKENKIPTYIILLGNEYDMDFMTRIAQEANSSLLVNPLVEKVADVLKNNSYFFKKFIYVVPKNSPKSRIRKIVKQISEKRSFKFEFFVGLVVLIIIIFIWIISLFKSPRPGDREIFFVSYDSPTFVEMDRNRLEITPGKYNAIASFSYRFREISDYKKRLRGVDRLNKYEKYLLGCDVKELGIKLKEMQKSSDDDEVTTATNLSYYCSDLDDKEIEKIFNGPKDESIDAKKFLFAMVFLSMAKEIYEKIMKKRFFVSILKGKLIKKELSVGDTVEIGGYELKLLDMQDNKENGVYVEFEVLQVPFLKWKILPSFLRKMFSLITLGTKKREHFGELF